MKRFSDIIIMISEAVTRRIMWICVISIMIMMFLTAFDVCGRYFLNKPIQGALEVTEILMVMMVAAGFAYTQKKKGHISVELFVARLPLRVQKVIYVFDHCVCLGLYILITWQCAKGGLVQWRNSVTSGGIEIPLWPFYYFLALGSGVLCLAFLCDILKILHGEGKKE